MSVIIAVFLASFILGVCVPIGITFLLAWLLERKG